MRPKLTMIYSNLIDLFNKSHVKIFLIFMDPLIAQLIMRYYRIIALYHYRIVSLYHYPIIPSTTHKFQKLFASLFLNIYTRCQLLSPH